MEIDKASRHNLLKLKEESAKHDDGIFGIKYNGESKKEVLPVKDYNEAVKLVMDALIKDKIISSYDEIKAIGHRIVQGGPYFSASAIINDDTLNKVESLIPLSPNHNAAELVGIRAFMKVLPHTPGICTFDTAFHQTQSDVDKIFPIPYEYTKKYMIYRFGAHVKNLIKNLDLTEIQNLVENKTSTIVCLFRTVKKITTKNNKTMAFITAYDDANDLDITLFSDTYEKYIDLINKLKKKDIILVTGRLERNRKNNELGFVMDEIKLLEEGNTQNG